MPIFILLFWLSLAPFAPAWMGQNHLAPAPVAFYGFILLSAGIGYFILTRSLVAHDRQGSKLVKSVGSRTSLGLKDSFDVSFAVQDANDVHGVFIQGVVNANRFEASDRP